MVARMWTPYKIWDETRWYGGRQRRSCALCQRHLHRLYDTGTLKQHYSTLAKIRASPEVQKLVRWLRKE